MATNRPSPTKKSPGKGLRGRTSSQGEPSRAHRDTTPEARQQRGGTPKTHPTRGAVQSRKDSPQKHPKR